MRKVFACDLRKAIFIVRNKRLSVAVYVTHMHLMRFMVVLCTRAYAMYISIRIKVLNMFKTKLRTLIRI